MSGKWGTMLLKGRKKKERGGPLPSCPFCVLTCVKPRKSEQQEHWSPRLCSAFAPVCRQILHYLIRETFCKCSCLVFPVRYRPSIALRGMGWGLHLHPHVHAPMCVCGESRQQLPSPHLSGCLCLCEDLASAEHRQRQQLLCSGRLMTEM